MLVRVLGLHRWRSQAPLLRPRQLRVQFRVPPRLQLTIRLLPVLRFLRPSVRHRVGSCLALILRAPLLTPVHLRSRRIATPRAFSRRRTLRPLAWQTSFMRSVLSLVRRAAVLRPGSASQSLRLPVSASSFTPESRRGESEVSGRAEALVRHTKPLSHVLPRRLRKYAVADNPLYASSLPVNPSFAQLAGARAVGSKRWGSISFSEMERMECVFRNQLEMTSSSLWLMSGILAMLKRDGFQPSDPTLFNVALSSVSAAMSQQARSAAAGSTFLRSKRKESLLSHTSVPVPEAQRRSLATSPGSSTGLFDESLLSDVVAQVQHSSMISSNLAVSCSFGQARSRASSSSPLVDPSPSRPPRAGRSFGKRSASSSQFSGGKRFRGGKGSAPSSKPSGFRK